MKFSEEQKKYIVNKFITHAGKTGMTNNTYSLLCVLINNKGGSISKFKEEVNKLK